MKSRNRGNTLTGAMAVLVLAAVGAAHADERWATTVGYQPEHVIVDAKSPEGARLELQYPARPRPKLVPPPARLALNNVQVQLSAALAALSAGGTAGTPPVGGAGAGAADSGANATANPVPEAVVGDAMAGVTSTGTSARGAENLHCGVSDATGLTVCMDASGRLRAEDKRRVREFLTGPAVVYTADAAGRVAMAEALDAVAPALRDVVVREDGTRVRPGLARIERRVQ